MFYFCRGDTAFCSQECREQQMNLDEWKEKYSLAASKKDGSHRHHSPPNTATATATSDVGLYISQYYQCMFLLSLANYLPNGATPAALFYRSSQYSAKSHRPFQQSIVRILKPFQIRTVQNTLDSKIESSKVAFCYLHSNILEIYTYAAC